jgi:hypothetical protein
MFFFGEINSKKKKEANRTLAQLTQGHWQAAISHPFFCSSSTSPLPAAYNHFGC